MRGSRFTQPARSEALPTLGSSQPLSLPSASTLGPSELLSCFGVGATRLQARPQLLKVGAGSGGVDAPLSLAATVPSRAFAAMSASALGGASGSSVLTGSKTTVTKASAAVARLQAATQRVVLWATAAALAVCVAIATTARGRATLLTAWTDFQARTPACSAPTSVNLPACKADVA